MECLGSILDVLMCLGDPTCRYIDHHRKLKQRNNDLQARLGLLNAIKIDVERRKKADLRWGKCTWEEVEKWLLDVQAINDQIRDIDEKMQNVCFFSRAHLRKCVAQMVERVKELIDQGRFTESLVIDDLSTAGVAFPLEHLEGGIAVNADIWNFLVNDEVGMIGVCGMGGIGNSTSSIYMKTLQNAIPKDLGPVYLNPRKGQVIVFSSQLDVFEIRSRLRKKLDFAEVLYVRRLRACTVDDCEDVESMLDLSLSSSPYNPLENLEYLGLVRLAKLHVLVKVGEASVISSVTTALPMPDMFSNLKSLAIVGCPNIKQFLPFELAHHFQNLERLEAWHCRQMEEIIGSDEEEEIQKGKGTKAPTEFSFPKLKKLVLMFLPELKSICGSSWVMACNCLTEIVVWECTELKRMPLYLPLFQDTNQSVPSLHPFESISISPMEWWEWERVEWDYPNAKEVLQPWLEETFYLESQIFLPAFPPIQPSHQDRQLSHIPMLCDSNSRPIPSGFSKSNCIDEIVMFINAGGDTLYETDSRMKLLGDTYFEIWEYRFNNLPPGDYFVDLHFAEIINTNGPKGMRVFNVYMQEEKGTVTF
ncbi:hypothetical protein V6N11_023465 [Hibiscus sabdariffa]|uniref:Uncharacterized protein n=1 Tax=Hibiscus sabdariffa TaxID=183260 RepID=A0ABR2TMB2_9ROSI